MNSGLSLTEGARFYTPLSKTVFVTSELFWDAGTTDLDNWTQERALYSARLYLGEKVCECVFKSLRR